MTGILRERILPDEFRNEEGGDDRTHVCQTRLHISLLHYRLYSFARSNDASKIALAS